MNVLIVSGIWPPDVGGPASHAPDVAAALTANGHSVRVITTADRAPEPQAYAIDFVSRSLPAGLRHAAVSAMVARRSAAADVVYATSMVGRSGLVARAPLVVKIAGDAAFERALRHGLYAGGLADFAQADLGYRARFLRSWRSLVLRTAAHILCPSEFLREVVISWGVRAAKVSVLPNATPTIPALRDRAQLRASFGMNGPSVAFAGRLTQAKAVHVLREAVELVPEVSLFAAGDGEERRQLYGPRVHALGALPRERVLELLVAADTVALSSAWENFPHVLVEALAVGTPVIATAVGGVPEIVVDGVNGFLVPPHDPVELAEAIRRLVLDADLRSKLADRAAGSVERFSAATVYGELEAILATVAERKRQS